MVAAFLKMAQLSVPLVFLAVLGCQSPNNDQSAPEGGTNLFPDPAFDHGLGVTGQYLWKNTSGTGTLGTGIDNTVVIDKTTNLPASVAHGTYLTFSQGACARLDLPSGPGASLPAGAGNYQVSFQVKATGATSVKLDWVNTYTGGTTRATATQSLAAGEWTVITLQASVDGSWTDNKVALELSDVGTGDTGDLIAVDNGYLWVLDDDNAAKAAYAFESLTNLAENSQPHFAYNYAEDIGDGRGITFGIVGFCSGTKDGTTVLKALQIRKPKHLLVTKYLAAFEAIDSLPHPDGNCNDETGLGDPTGKGAGFVQDFEKYGADPDVRAAQLEIWKVTYYTPAAQCVADLGIKNPLTVGEIYDITINHGTTTNGTDLGLDSLVNRATALAGGNPGGTVDWPPQAAGNTVQRAQIDESLWLGALLQVRYDYLNGDTTWRQALDRIGMYRRILSTGNIGLTVPFKASCYGQDFTILGTQP